MHLLGVGHEQQRPDRDLYIAVNWTNIHTDHVFNFFKVCAIDHSIVKSSINSLISNAG